MGKKKKETYEAVYIEWIDAMAHDDVWIDEEDAVKWAEGDEGLVKQVGWIIKETSDYILLASRLGEINRDTPDFGGVFKIPTKWMRVREELSRAR